MNSSKHAKWLLDQLPYWQEKQWITPSAANDIKRHYQPLIEKSPPNPVFLITGILGALLIGTGYHFHLCL